jgi:HAD superfamily hydrolase (TIGR01484 family)
MKPLADFPADIGRGLRGVFTDIDDTLTCEGYLPAQAYAAMEQMQQAGLLVVPITGRPAGWCDLIARLWPVNGVVGENGAFYFHYDRARKKMIRHYSDDAKTRQQNRNQLIQLAEQVLREIPGAAVSADQAYRETDLAVDFCEDVPPLAAEAVQEIVQLLKGAGATVKVSSIHVNAWFGEYDKLTMTKSFARDILQMKMDAHEGQFIFIGDSPNDAPMFSYFSNSVGVQNIRDFADQIDILPKFIAKGHGGEGFAELASLLVTLRKNAA